MESSLKARIIKENTAMHKISPELPSWLIWRGNNQWLVQLAIRSGAKETRANGELDGRLKLSIKAPPIEGRANQAIVQSIALAAGIPTSRVQLVSGAKSKHKSLVIEMPEEASDSLAKQLASIGH
jgi:uncharacterized protein (TIGR00251 family)